MRFVCLQTAMTSTNFVRNNNLVVLWSHNMVQEVANSYTSLPEYGFAAFKKATAFAEGKGVLDRYALQKSPTEAAYVYIDKCPVSRPGYSAVDMLGNCNVKVRKQTLKLLHTLKSNAQANLQAAVPAVEESVTFSQIFTRLAILIIGTACFVAWLLR